ncbi:hypothetical protein D0T84_12790 [Dysgonomonas sp. 521]|uniref:hypothetical protein n=1 Tax=Dysgonomonas sp. 521 TaxID=2302932 RepID=UPI0013D0BADB|nr:hypothetical protein [Dysgonomonas sp. 521]NDV95779.1 hypothetical protein [Dysgonomonas sp. 521]
MMNKLHTLSLLLFLSNFLHSQEKTPVFHEDSIYMYNAVNLSELDSYKISVVSSLDLSEPVATYAATDTMPPLPHGHYWQVMKQGDKILSGLYTNDNFNYAVIRYTKNPSLFFYDDNGNPLEDIFVHYLNKVYKPDPLTQLVSLDNLLKDRTPMTVYNNGIKYDFEIWDEQKDIKDIPVLWPFAPQEKNSLFAKTEYKCGDTIPINVNASDFDYIQFYGTSANILYSSPIKKNMNYKETYINSIILNEECPYLTDGNVGIYLSKEKDKYDKENLFLKSFDYITSDYNLSVEIDNRKHLKENPPTLSMLVTEPDNNYSDKDYILIYVYTESVKKAWDDSVFVPQTLLIDTIPFSVNKEIQYTLPQKIFSHADIEYKIRVNLYRNGKIAKHKLLEIQSLGSAEMFVLSEKDYKLDIQKINSKGSLPGEAVLEIFGRGWLLSRQQVKIPCSLDINPNARYYKVTSGNISDSIIFRNKDTCPINYNIQPYGTDSVTISIENPSGYSFWYTIWEKDKMLRQEYSSQARFNLKKVKDGDYILRLEYMYGGQIQELQTKLCQQKQDVLIKPKQITSSYNYIHVLNTKETSWNTKKVPVKVSHSTSAQKGYTRYEEALDLLSKPQNRYAYSNLNLSFKNEDMHRAKYIVFVDTTKTDPYDKLQVFKAGQASITLSPGKSYIMYILSDGTLVYKQPVMLQKQGYYFLTLDMSRLHYSDRIDKEIEALMAPFLGKKHIKIIVLDSNKAPLIGASIKLKGTNIGAISDLDGVAMLTFPSGFRGDIEISLIGLKPQRIPYKGQQEIRVEMEGDYTLLE